jgi:hypothetical protein
VITDEILQRVQEILRSIPPYSLSPFDDVIQHIFPLLIDCDNETRHKVLRDVSSHFDHSVPIPQVMGEHLQAYLQEHGVLTDLQEGMPEQPSLSEMLSRRPNAVSERRPVQDPPSERGSSGNKARPTALFDGLVEIVEQDRSPAFLVKLQNGNLTVLQEHHIGETHLAPPSRRQIPWLLPRAQEVQRYYERYEHESAEVINGQLFDDIVRYHQNLSVLPGVEYYDLIATFDFHTYCLDAFEYSPMICFFAVPERGKSRTGKAMIHVCYRGLHVESLREAYIFRMSDRFQSTLFFDVQDIWKRAEREGSEDILLQRYERGGRVARVLFPDRGPFKDLEFFNVFGATIIATNEPPNQILETRAIIVNMPEASRRFEEDVTPLAALPLKERLTAFRAWQLARPVPEVSKPSLGRLGDILKPLLQMILLVRPERESAFRELVTRLEQQRLVEKADSLEAEILNALEALRLEVAAGILPVKRITDQVNVPRAERYKLTPQRIGRRLSGLGLNKARTGDGASAIVWESGKINALREKYGLRIMSETSESPESKVSPIVSPGVLTRAPVDGPLPFGKPLKKPNKSEPTGGSDVSGVSDD